MQGRFRANGNQFHVLEEPTSLNTLQIIPELDKAGIVAVKIEGRQRSPAYAARVVGVGAKPWMTTAKCNLALPSSVSGWRRWESVSEGAKPRWAPTPSPGSSRGSPSKNREEKTVENISGPRALLLARTTAGTSTGSWNRCRWI